MKNRHFISLFDFLPFLALVACLTSMNPMCVAQVDCNRNFIFQKQSQIDSFHLKFPECVESPKSIYVMGSDITNVDSLVYVKEIKLDLIIQNNSKLLNLNGLRNLKTIKRHFFISNNKILDNLDGLDNLISSQDIIIEKNENLADFSSLDNLVEVNEIEIMENAGLINLNAFNGLKQFDKIDIHDNPNLFSISGIGGIENAGYIYIHNNPKLTFFSAFPNTKKITGIDFKSNSIIQFDGFESLDTVVGHLRFTEDTILTTLGGFGQLKHVGGQFIISSLPALNEIKAFSNLRTIDDQLYITSCDALLNVGAFQTLRYVKGEINIYSNKAMTSIKSFNLLDSCGNRISISELPKLRTLNAFKNVKVVLVSLQLDVENLEVLNGFQSLREIKTNYQMNSGEVTSLILHSEKIQHCNEFSNLIKVRGLSLYRTPLLKDLSGFDMIDTSYFKFLKLWNNPDFTACHSSFFCRYLEDPNHKYYIGGNAPGCNTREEILASCTTGTNEWHTSSTATGVFPNPCPLNSSLWFTGQEADFHLTLYTTTGQRAFEGRVSNPVKLPVNRSGLYHYRLTNEGKQKSGAVVFTE